MTRQRERERTSSLLSLPIRAPISYKGTHLHLHEVIHFYILLWDGYHCLPNSFLCWRLPNSFAMALGGDGSLRDTIYQASPWAFLRNDFCIAQWILLNSHESLLWKPNPYPVFASCLKYNCSHLPFPSAPTIICHKLMKPKSCLSISHGFELLTPKASNKKFFASQC